MLRSLLLKRMWDRWPGYIWWLAGLGALTALSAGFWPTIRRDTDALGQLFDRLPEGFLRLFGATDIEGLFTASGFINSRIYSSVGAIVVVFFAISMGTQAIAGEEDTRTIDLLLAQPVTRRTVVLESFWAMLVMTSGLALGVWIVLAIFEPIVDLGLPLAGVFAATVGMVLLALVFGTLSLAIGGLTGSRGLAIGAGAGATFGTFFINGLAPLVDQIAWTQKLTPFFWFLDGRPLDRGFAWQFLVLVAAIVVLLGLALWGFERRDVAV